MPKPACPNVAPQRAWTRQCLRDSLTNTADATVIQGSDGGLGTGARCASGISHGAGIPNTLCHTTPTIAHLSTDAKQRRKPAQAIM